MVDFGELVFAEGLYWRERYPNCPSCWDVERKPVRLGGPVQTDFIPRFGNVPFIRFTTLPTRGIRFCFESSPLRPCLPLDWRLLHKALDRASSATGGRLRR